MSSETFGHWLKVQRRKRGLTQRDITERTGIGPTHLSAMENNRIELPNDETRARIHAALGTSEDDLVAIGILERIDASHTGPPVYIAAASITPVDRAAASVREPAPTYDQGDPRRQLMDLLADASDADVRKVVDIVSILLGVTRANRGDLLRDIEAGA